MQCFTCVCQLTFCPPPCFEVAKLYCLLVYGLLVVHFRILFVILMEVLHVLDWLTGFDLVFL